MSKEQLTTNEQPLPLVTVSVREMVEFLMRSGDIDRRVQHGPDPDAMLAGANLHRRIQKRQGAEYSAEVSLKTRIAYEDLILQVEGRADGVIRKDPLPDHEEVPVTVDEIKGMYLDVTKLKEPFPVHLAQAKCYAAVICEEEDLPVIGVRMTYANLDSEELVYFHSVYPKEDLTSWFASLCDSWHLWAAAELRHREERDASIRTLTFPFPFREGQQHLAASVYHTIKESSQLFLMAPTGVGKTISCVYPSVRAVGAGLSDRIFYLTAKNETLSQGAEAFSLLMEQGLSMRIVRITAKEKTCPLSEASCNPEDCPRAKGHFDRINDVLFTLLSEERPMDRSFIEQTAAAHLLCPYELSLDLASFADAVLCDYNYVFDPNAQLKRFFAGGRKGNGIFLIDEAHNLPDRAREMYSAALIKEELLKAKKYLGTKLEDQSPRAETEAEQEMYNEQSARSADEERLRKRLIRALDAANRELLALKHRLTEDPHDVLMDRPYLLPTSEETQRLIRHALKIQTSMTEYFEECRNGALKEKLLDFYFSVIAFAATADYLDEHYTVYAALNEDGHFFVRLFCANPSGRLSECLMMGRAAVFFSATLLPLGYYKKLLTTKEEPFAVYAKTPFRPERRLLLAASDVSTVYRKRGPAMYRRIASYLQAAAESRPGNYLVFFPSYSMMRNVFEIYREEFDTPGIDYVCQSPGMQDDDREIFMENFYEDPARSLLAFSVMGGMFSEGIDLVGTRLIGAIVVGAGLPQVSVERELLKQHYDSTSGEGFDYAYRFPGMNKVEQAAGRVIRTASDRGVILLLDDRLLLPSYARLLPREWQDLRVTSLQDVREQLASFWTCADP